MEDQAQLIQKQGEQIKKLRKDMKYLIDDNYNYHTFLKKEFETLREFLKVEVNMLHSEIDDLAEDIDYIKTKSSSASRHLKSLAKGLKLPVEQFLSDTDNELIRRPSRHSRGRKSKKPEVYGSLNDLPRSTVTSPLERHNFPYRSQERSYSPSSSDSGEHTSKQVDMSPRILLNSPYSIIKDDNQTANMPSLVLDKEATVHKPIRSDSTSQASGSSKQASQAYGSSNQTSQAYGNSNQASQAYGSFNQASQASGRSKQVDQASINSNQATLDRKTLHPVQNTSTVLNRTGTTSTPVSSTTSPSNTNIPMLADVNVVTMETNVKTPSENTNVMGTSDIGTVDTKVTPMPTPGNQTPNQQGNVQIQVEDMLDFDTVEGYMTSCRIDITSETKKAIEEAFKGDEHHQSKPYGIYTILLVDTSKSMDGEPGKQMKKCLVEFIDEVENSAANNSLEENVAVVTFGATTSIMNRFTNDYGKIREVVENLQFEGRSPILTGLAMCVKYLRENSTVLDMSSVVSVPPRIILVTDGLLTGDSSFTGQDQEQNTIQCESKIFDFIKKTQQLGYPIIRVGVEEYNKAFLQNFPCAGGLSEADDVMLLARYYFYETVVSQVIEKNDEIGGHGNIPDLVRMATQGDTHLSQRDHEEISRLLREHNIEYVVQPAGPESDGELFEEFGVNDMYARLLSIGTRVKRGPGWEWGDQDGNGPGTVVAHKDKGQLVVKWDNGVSNIYSYNHNSTSHVMKCDSMRILKPGEDIQVGCCVKRGIDWDPVSEEDGGSGTIGIVIRKHHDKTVSVRWPSQVVERYSFGHNNKYQLEVVNRHVEAQPDTGFTDGTLAEDVPGGQDIVYAWQWQDPSQQWRTLIQAEADKLEDYYQNKKQGTVLVTHYNTQMRCDPLKLQHNLNGFGKLQRIMLPQSELNSLHELELLMLQG